MGMKFIERLMGPPKKKELEILPTQKLDGNAYLELAKKAGFDNATIAVKHEQHRETVAKLRSFLAENGICVYDKKAVHRYMHGITPFDMHWRWVPLGSYKEPIPEAVLMTMATIREAFPSVRFDVTVIDQGKDPFLRCWIPEREYALDSEAFNEDEAFIIERWDEPGFRQ